jgi:integrase
LFVLPLPPAAIDIIASLPRIGAYCITTTGETPVSGYAKAKQLLDKAIAAEMMKSGAAPPAGFVLHDLRRTAATGMARLGIPRFTIARILDHADNTVTGGYDRYDQLSEKRDALTRWCDHVLGLVRPKLAAVG